MIDLNQLIHGEIVNIEDLPEELQKSLKAQGERSDPLLESIKNLEPPEDSPSVEPGAAMERLLYPYVPISTSDVPKLIKKSPARRKSWMRNKPCPCGSGRKFKRCCWGMFSE